MNFDKIRKSRIYLLIDICMILMLAVTVVCNVAVIVSESGRTYGSASDVPHNRFGLLLGTEPRYCGGEKNYLFDNRVDAAAELYNAGKVDYIIASGVDLTDIWGSDEPAEMRDSLVERGVPADRVLLDYEGDRTISSVAKAADVYGLKSVTMISQKEHNLRAIWQARHFNIDAVGYNARETHVASRRFRNASREAVAKVKMFVDLAAGHRPQFCADSVRKAKADIYNLERNENNQLH